MAVLCIRRNEAFSVCSGMSLKALNIDGFQAIRFTNNEGFIVETSAAAVGDIDNAEYVLSQNKYLGTITLCLDNLNQSK